MIQESMVKHAAVDVVGKYDVCDSTRRRFDFSFGALTCYLL